MQNPWVGKMYYFDMCDAEVLDEIEPPEVRLAVVSRPIL